MHKKKGAQKLDFWNTLILTKKYIKTIVNI
ncbi:hypothetical protein QFZ72_000686 [Bacillus sp. V2I10]|nr:hypothetical protein [Bacillus sp. V2I10]